MNLFTKQKQTDGYQNVKGGREKIKTLELTDTYYCM